MVIAMASVEPSRTFHANQAVQISDLVSLKFGDQTFGTAQRRVLRVTEPDGPSTDGGLKARQSIILVPEGAETSAGAVLCGFIDVSRRSAELRPYATVSQQHQSRFGAPLDISKLEYERCIQEVHEFLRTQAIDSRIQLAPNGRRSQPPAPAAASMVSSQALQRDEGGSPMPLVMVGAVCFVVGFLLCYVLFAAGIVVST